MLPSSEGKLPAKLFWFKPRNVIARIKFTLDGMLPVNLFVARFTVCIFVSRPIELGRGPSMLLLFTCSTVNASRFPIEDGRVPRIARPLISSFCTRDETQTTPVHGVHRDNTGIPPIHDQPDTKLDRETSAAAKSHIAVSSAPGCPLGFPVGLLVGSDVD